MADKQEAYNAFETASRTMEEVLQQIASGINELEEVESTLAGMNLEPNEKIPPTKQMAEGLAEKAMGLKNEIGTLMEQTSAL